MGFLFFSLLTGRKIDNWFHPTNFYSSTETIYIRFSALDIPVCALNSLRILLISIRIHYVSVISDERVYAWSFFPLQFNWNKWEFFFESSFSAFFNCLHRTHTERILAVVVVVVSFVCYQYIVCQSTYVEILLFKLVCLALVDAVHTVRVGCIPMLFTHWETHTSLWIYWRA